MVQNPKFATMPKLSREQFAMRCQEHYDTVRLAMAHIHESLVAVGRTIEEIYRLGNEDLGATGSLADIIWRRYEHTLHGDVPLTQLEVHVQTRTKLLKDFQACQAELMRVELAYFECTGQHLRIG